MTKLETLYEWLGTCEIIADWLYFNAVRMEQNNVSLNPISDNVITPYASGASENELVFAIDFIKLYDLEQSDTNIDSMESVLGLAEWISTETTLPDFGDGFITNKVEILEEVPSILVDQDSNLCKYQFQARVSYTKL